MLSAIRLRAPSTPSGRPIAMQTATATTIKAMVSMASAHISIKPIKSRATAVNRATLPRPRA